MTREEILEQISAERVRQDLKWGATHELPATRCIHKWLSILTEEVGEAAEAALNYADTEVRAELVQIAAVAVSTIEHIDLNGVNFE